MRTFQQVNPLRTYLRTIRQEGKTIGFVPTMGALHEGHLHLARRAKGDCDIVVMSIFVNPTQFGPNEDFEAYPRDLNRDLALASHANVDAIFSPDLEEIYPTGNETIVDVPNLGCLLEGAARPTHFRGVATVVTKLLNIIQPDNAYFGQKDYQQLLVIERLTRDLHLTAKILSVPTVREPDGLALSSRNVYLTSEERKAATVLSRCLQHAQERVTAGATDPQILSQEILAMLAGEPLANVDYAVLVNPDTLEPVTSLAGGITLLALAVRFGKTRLIDNALLVPEGVALPKNRVGRGA